MLRDNERTLTSNGFIMKPFELPKFEIINRGGIFPGRYATSSSGYIYFTTTTQNTIYIDFGDGSEIYSENFNGQIRLRADNPVHTYSQSGDYKVKIWFKLPNKISNLIFAYVNFRGPIPIALSMYNLTTLEMGIGQFDSYDDILPPSIYNSVSIGNPTIQPITMIPLGLLNSYIKTLKIGSGFDFRNEENRLDELYKIKGLENISFNNLTRIDDIPSNLYLTPQLIGLGIGGSTSIREITPNIAACTRIETLTFGYYSSGPLSYTSGDNWNGLNSWGVGIGTLINLNVLNVDRVMMIPASSPPGLENCPNLKTLNFNFCFLNENRISSFIGDLYRVVTNIANINIGNTLLRQVKLNITTATSANITPYRPIGVYQAPEGYIQGESNGEPTNVMEMIYVLVKQYHWTIIVTNETLNGSQTLTP